MHDEAAVRNAYKIFEGELAVVEPAHSDAVGRWDFMGRSVLLLHLTCHRSAAEKLDNCTKVLLIP